MHPNTTRVTTTFAATLRRAALALLLLTLPAVAVAACGGGNAGSDRTDSTAPARTQRERDSAIAESGLPGARGIHNAQRAVDSTQARSQVMDSIGPP